MKLKRKLLISAVALALAGQFSALSAKSPVDQKMINDARAMVDTPDSGLFVTAPFINNLMVMNVRVFNLEGDMVLNYRSQGETVELLAADLPDGDYRYEAVSVFLLDEPVGDGADFTDEGISRNNGRFTIKDRTLVQPDTSRIEERKLQDEFSFKDTMINHATAALAFVLSPFVSEATADVFTTVEIDSSNPYLQFDDSSSVSIWDWDVYGNNNSTDNDGHFLIEDWVGGNASAVLDFHTTGGSTNLLQDSIVVESNGDIYWSNSGMTFDRSQQQLSIGTTATLYEFNISSTSPDVHLIDESDTGAALMQLNSPWYRIWGKTTSAESFDNIVNMHVNAPDYSLMIDDSGNVGLGTASPQEKLHAAGNIRTDGYFRGQSVSPGFWIDETGTGNKGANVVLDGGVLQFQRRAQGFGPYEAAPVRVFINAPMNSFVVNASGYLGLGINPTTPVHAVNGARLSIGGVWQNASSRELKENIHDLDSAEAMAAFKALEPVAFNYKVDSEETYLGFIAEDVPEIVASNDRGTLSSMDIIALLTQVVQDQQNTIEQQNERMNQLETMIRMVAGLENTDTEVAVNTR